MIVVFKGHSLSYEIKNIIMLFFPLEKLCEADEIPEKGDFVYAEKAKRQGLITLSFKAKIGDAELRGKVSANDAFNDPRQEDKECERLFGVMLYKNFQRLLKKSPHWGILTGIRPVTIARRLKAEGKTEEEIKSYFTKDYLVSPKKTELMLKTAKKEQEIIDLSAANSFSLYISIPFCPTRCAYCSFVSQSIERQQGLVCEYLEKLCNEIAVTGEIAKKLNLRLETVYIGGGTPTTLSAPQLKTLFEAVRGAFDLSTVREYTVEAGRPDTITAEKLAEIKQSEATRISINPQTLNDEILNGIGRRHTTRQTLESFALARKAGLGNINMDLIAGLPDESLESFKNSVDGCIALNPENITVHTLSLKRSANLSEGEQAKRVWQEENTANMMDYATERLGENGYEPYYLYRQRNTKENLENVGFAKAGYEGLYNVYIMDETHSILACGAGGVTKLKQPAGNTIERVFNYKLPLEYIKGFDEMIKRKNRW